MTTPNIPMVNAGLMYVNNMLVSPGTLDVGTGLFCVTLGIGSGQARDSTDTNDITLSAAVTLSIAATVIGQVNGLDAGTGLTANAFYGVYVIGDSTGYQPSGSLLSLSMTSPQLPEGYDMFRRVGAVKANSAATGILNFVQTGNGGTRDTWYGAALATAAITPADTAFHAITLTTQVPVSGAEVYVRSALSADAGGTRTVIYAANANSTVAQGATGQAIMSSPASTVTTSSLKVPVNSAAGVQTIQFALSSASVTALTVTIEGFKDFL